MPPWKVEPGIGPFVGQRLLTDEEIAIDRTMGEEQHAEGDPQELPPLPKHADGWLLGKPDLIVKPMRRSRCRRSRPTPSASSRSGCRSRSAPTSPASSSIPATRASCITPTSASIARRDAPLDEADPLPGYDGLMPRSAEYPDGHFLGWTPGQVAPLVQPELAWTLEPGSDLVVQLHLQPTGAAEEVLAEIGFYFTDRAPAHADDPSARLAGHRHSAGRRAT